MLSKKIIALFTSASTLSSLLVALSMYSLSIYCCAFVESAGANPIAIDEIAIAMSNVASTDVYLNDMLMVLTSSVGVLVAVGFMGDISNHDEVFMVPLGFLIFQRYGCCSRSAQMVR